jgi:methylenetetrahydrofolate reductase (NADPH)
MALRGDAMKDEQSFVPKWNYNFAVDLVQQIKLLNEGKYMHDVMHVDNKADFVLECGLSGEAAHGT